MMCVVVLVGALAATSGPMFKTFIADMPAVRQAIEVNGALGGMLRRMRDDVAAARSLPVEAGGRKASPTCMLIETPRALVAYEFGEKEVTRRAGVAAGAGAGAVAVVGDEGDVTVWRTPRGRVDWRVRRKDGRAVAVEVSTAVERQTAGGTKPKLANSHVFFLGGGD